ncbi:MAG: hypothetical protein L6R42_005063, partial [Xanthoria sp. 1 TBL-2021]
MSGDVGLPAPKALLKGFSVEDVDKVVKSTAAARVAVDSKPELPEGARIASANAHGASFWTQTARLEVVLSDGSEIAYFLKIAKDDIGKGMLTGVDSLCLSLSRFLSLGSHEAKLNTGTEYESAKLLHSFSPNGLPKPVAFGTYASDPNSHFYLCAFIDMALRIPDPAKFCAILAEMHQNSIGHSPEGKYGFHVTTYQGNMPQNNGWTDTWEEYYVRGLKDFIKQEQAVQGRSDQLEELLVPFFEKVVPRLLRPLEWGETKIKPCLLHGDIWCGNIAERTGTDEPIMFDPAAFWAHNEFKLSLQADELGSFRVPRYKLGPQWLEEYHKHFPVSEPQKDVDDRNLIYS